MVCELPIYIIHLLISEQVVLLVDSPRYAEGAYTFPEVRTNILLKTCTNFIVAFPSGCPFLTSVGAVSGIPPSETAASFSSGGFSRVFAQPSYQSTAVATYLTALGTTNSGKFTPTGRAFPDVSTQGGVYLIHPMRRFF